MVELVTDKYEGEGSSTENTHKKGGARVQRDVYGNTPLHKACQAGNEDEARALLKANADVHDFNMLDFTPLHVAGRYGNSDIIRLLITHGADPNVRNKLGNTPLHLASSTGRIDAIKALIEMGADVNACMGDGKTPLHLAYMNNHAGAVRLLMELGANIKIRNDDGLSPLDMTLKLPDDDPKKEKMLNIFRELATEVVLEKIVGLKKPFGA